MSDYKIGDERVMRYAGVEYSEEKWIDEGRAGALRRLRLLAGRGLLREPAMADGRAVQRADRVPLHVPGGLLLLCREKG